MRRRLPILFGTLALVGAVFSACGSTEEPVDSSDSGAIDSATEDAGSVDMGAADVATAAEDTGPEDTGPAEDVPAPCPSACTETAPRCVNGQPHACEDNNGDGCKTWTAKAKCEKGFVCDEGTCTQLHCGKGTVLKDGVCVVIGCPKKQIRIDGKCVDNPCGEGTKWRDGKCQAPCPKGCTLGAKRCEKGWPQTCQAIGTDKCPGWVTGSGCPYWTYCHAGSCTTGDQAIFEPIPGSGGVRATAIALSKVDTRIAFAGAELGGISTSGDGGKTWHVANEGLWRGVSHSVAALDIHPKNPRHALAAVGGTSDEPGATYRTLNGGLTWTKTSGLTCFQATGPDRVTGALFARDPNNPNLVYLAASRCGVLRSTNGGASWGVMGFMGRLVASVVPDPKKKGSFVAAVLDDPNTGAKGGIWTGVNNKWVKRSSLSVRTLAWWKGAWYAGSKRGIEVLDAKWQAKPFWPAKPCAKKNELAPDVRSLAAEWDGLLVGAAKLPDGVTSCVGGARTGGVFKVGTSAAKLADGTVQQVVTHGKTALAAGDSGVWTREQGAWTLAQAEASGWMAVDATGAKLRGGGVGGVVETVATKNVGAAKKCDGITLGGRCHRAFKSTASFSAADASCKAWGGHLTSPRGSGEILALRSYATSVCGNVDFWVGYTDAKKEGDFVWTDGSNHAWAPWLSGQPDNNGKAGESVTQLRRDRQYNDIPATSSQTCFVCSRPAAFAAKSASTPVTTKCDEASVIALAGDYMGLGGAASLDCERVFWSNKGKLVAAYKPGARIRSISPSVPVGKAGVTGQYVVYGSELAGKAGFTALHGTKGLQPTALVATKVPAGDPVRLTSEGSTVNLNILTGNSWLVLDGKIIDQTKQLHGTGLPKPSARLRWAGPHDKPPVAVAGWDANKSHLVARWTPKSAWKKEAVPAINRRITALAIDAAASTMIAIVAATKTQAPAYFTLKKGSKQWMPISRMPVHGTCSMLRALPGGDFIAYGRSCTPSWVRLL